MLQITKYCIITFLLLKATIVVANNISKQQTISYQEISDARNIKSQDVITKTIRDYLSHRFLNATFIFATQDDIIEMGAMGLASLDGKVLTATQSMFLSSLHRQVLAAAVLRLRDQGLLDINDTVIKFFDSKNKIWKSGNIPEWASKISIHHLLTHTSGLAEYVGKITIDHNSSISEINEKIINFIALKPLEFRPGKKFKYVNTNSILLYAIIAKISGKEVAKFLRDEFFKPLNMRATAFLTAAEMIKISTSKRHIYPERYLIESTGGKPKFIQASDTEYTDSHAAVASVISNTKDIIKWNRALHSGKLLSDESYDLMTTKHYQMHNTAGRKSYVGYGMFISKLEDGDMIFYNSGKEYGIRSETGYVPAKNLYFAILSNVTVKIPEKIREQIDSRNPNNQLDIIYFREAILKLIAKKAAN